MWEVYIIQSIVYKRYYIGYSQNARYRLDNYHNQGKCKSTKPYKPYRLIIIEKYTSRSEAMRREKEIKKMKGGNKFTELINLVVTPR